jgi:hypothetical protein
MIIKRPPSKVVTGLCFGFIFVPISAMFIKVKLQLRNVILM